MAPAPPAWPDAPADRETFVTDLQRFHQQRGTSLDLYPKVNNRNIDLFQLFQIVEGVGGYDAVSAEKLAWRKVGTDFSLTQNNAAAYAFALKTVYYKNLAAYAIKRVHKQEPPPREILEDTTAKGGDLLGRTPENFRPGSSSRGHFVDGEVADGSGDEGRGTPKAEKMELDDPGSGGGRRSLRQAPPQRVLFQPDLSSSRQRHPGGSAGSPQPTQPLTNGNYSLPTSSNPNSMSFSIANYEPRPPVALTLRPVATPTNNPAVFREKARRMHEAYLRRIGKDQSASKGMMLPGTGFDGPNIYVRTLLALRSSIQAEQEYALHHLVKISHERGDKYKFEAFPGLAEGLINKTLEVTSLFYKHAFKISYTDGASQMGSHILDGLYGALDIEDRLQKVAQLSVDEDIETEDFAHRLCKHNEAGLVLRNMSMLEENARYLADQRPVKDVLIILLNLPNRSQLTELKHYALDICEQLTRFWHLPQDDPLYLALLRFISVGEDRGAILTSIRAITRISLMLEEPNHLGNIPLSTLDKVINWTLLEDDELRTACLDLLYQYTAFPENILVLLDATASSSLAIHPLLDQLARLLSHNASPSTTSRTLAPAIPAQNASKLPPVPQSLMKQLLELAEPERSSKWLRACFAEDAGSELTQIALWQAYQEVFLPHCPAQGLGPSATMLQAAEFIKNVSSTLTAATAQVIHVEGAPPRFIIKGITYRHIPVDLAATPFSRCLWAPNNGGGFSVCGSFHLTPRDMWEHVLEEHLDMAKSAEGGGRWSRSVAVRASADDPEVGQKPIGGDEAAKRYTCQWAHCGHFKATGGDSPYAVSLHLKTHLSIPSVTSSSPSRKRRYDRTIPPNDPRPAHHAGDRERDLAHDLDILTHGAPAVSASFPFADTGHDERSKAPQPGLPLQAVLILRNVARNVPKALAQRPPLPAGTGAGKGLGPGLEGGKEKDTEKEKEMDQKRWLEGLFGPLRGRIWDVLGSNRSIRFMVWDLVGLVDKGMSG